MEKGKEFISPGIVYAPWTIQLEMPDSLKGGEFANWDSSVVFQFGPKKKYEILFVKEFVRRKNSASKLTQPPIVINGRHYEAASTSIRQTESQIIMDVNLVPKKTLEFIQMNMTILPEGGMESV